MACSLAEAPTDLIVHNPGEKPWVGVTLEWLKRCGVEFSNQDYSHYRVRGRSKWRSEEHTSELQSRPHLVCRLLLEKKKKPNRYLRKTVVPTMLTIRGNTFINLHRRIPCASQMSSLSRVHLSTSLMSVCTRHTVSVI